MDPKTRDLEYTPVEQIAGIHQTVYDTFHSHKTRPIAWRLKQLRKLWWGFKDAEAQILEACLEDVGKPNYEAYLTEVVWILNDIVFVCENLEKWAKDEKAADVPLLHMAVNPRIRKEPLGVVLIIGAFNYPFQLAIGPLIGAIAAGCTAVLKPSENAPRSTVLMQDIIAKCLDPTDYTVVQGGIPENTALLDCKWDKIFYTGSAAVGTIIAKKAAETLTPVTLELGGRNPAIVTRTADPRLAARRLIWSKMHNTGQVCVSQNYILVDQAIMPSFISEMKAAIAEFFPKGVAASPDFGRIAHDAAFQRLKAQLDSTNGKILIGGAMDRASKYLELTVVEVSSPDDPLLTAESFGPLIPILPVPNLDAALQTANSIHATPLAVYAFGSRADTSKILSSTRSGGASINDGMYHASIPTLEFGGVGDSGTGSYRGKASFDTFTHRRAVTSTPGWMEALLAIRYPPYEGKMWQYRLMTERKPDFDRSGVVTRSFVRTLLTLGGQTVGAGVKRLLVLVLFVLGARQYLVRAGRL